MGTFGDDLIAGLGGADTLNGGNGADRLIGGDGADTLSGGFGSDTFMFNSQSEGLDTITDFLSGLDPAADNLQISAAGFGGGLTVGGGVTLVTAASAATANNPGPGGYFIFDNSGANGGTVYWDANGGSGADAGALMVLAGVNSLQASDFHQV